MIYKTFLLKTLTRQNLHLVYDGAMILEENIVVCLYLLRLYWEIWEACASSSIGSANLSCCTVHTRAIPSEHAVTISPFSKNLASQTQPGCSMLWTQTPSARKTLSKVWIWRCCKLNFKLYIPMIWQGKH